MTNLFSRFVVALGCTALLAGPVLAQDAGKPKDEKKPAAAAPAKPDAKPQDKPAAGQQPSPEEQKAMMEQMMAMMQPGENHKLLENMAGEWNYTAKMFQDPSAPPDESTGVSTTKAVMGGRYFQTEAAGKFNMPGPDGKPMEMEFKGMGITGYDNAKKKHFTTWIDNMGTGVMMMEGDYDAKTKTFTYTGDYTPMPGMTNKVRQVIRVIDKDKHVMEWYETRMGTEVKVMEITYNRKK